MSFVRVNCGSCAPSPVSRKSPDVVAARSEPTCGVGFGTSTGVRSFAAGFSSWSTAPASISCDTLPSRKRSRNSESLLAPKRSPDE